MPAIPILRQQTAASDAGVGGTPVFGGGLQAVGEALDSASRTLFDVEQRQLAAAKKVQGERDTLDANTRLADLERRSIANLENGKMAATGDAAGFAGERNTQFKNDLQDVVDGANPNVQRLVRERGLAMGADLFRSSLQFEHGQATAHNAIAFSQGIDAWAAAVQQAPDRHDAAMRQQLDVLSSLNMMPEERERLAVRLESTMNEAAWSGFAAAQPRAAIDLLHNPDAGRARFGSLTPEASARVQRIATAGAVQAQTDGIVASYQDGGPDLGSKMLASLNQSGLDPELQDEVRSRVNAAMGQIRQQQRERFADKFVQVERGLASGTAGSAERHIVDQLFAANALTPIERGNYMGQIDRVVQSRKVEIPLAAKADEAVANGTSLDPNSVEDRKSLAASFGLKAAGLQEGTQEWRTLATAYAVRTRVVPEQSSSWARRSLRSPNAEVAIAAAQFIGGVRALAPEAVDGFDQATKARAELIGSMIDAGTKPQAAVDTARQLTEAPPQLLEQRKTEYRQIVKDQPNSLVLRDLVNNDPEYRQGLFHSDPVINSALQVRSLSGDFDMLTNDYFMRTGDVQVARKLAWADTRKIYGVSKVNGVAQMMAFPPERYGLSPERVHTTLGEYLKALPHYTDVKPEHLVLVPDAQTQRQIINIVNGQPADVSWAVVTKDGEPLLGENGMRKRYTPPNGEERAQRIREIEAKRAQGNQQIIDDTRQWRDRRDAVQAFQQTERDNIR